MGYNTQYRLTVQPPISLDDAYGAMISRRPVDDGYTSIGALLRGPISFKWYEWEAEMRAISLLDPSRIFILDATGEEAGDVWRAYFCNGKYQIAKAVIGFDAFDGKKLR